MTEPNAAPARRWTPVALAPDAAGRAAPAPKGAYSPGVRAGGFVFVSGQVPRDPHTGALVGEDDVRAQTRQTLANVAGVLAAAGATLADVVSVSVHLADVAHWPAFDAVYREVLAPPYPTRTVVGAALRGILVEVTAIAYVGDAAR
ncbi:MAG TPA: RidA family protein [Gemmatirosa sp.]